MLVRVVSPDFVAYLKIERGFCTQAEPALAHCVGASAPWCKGHFLYRGWHAVKISDRAAALAQTSFTA